MAKGEKTEGYPVALYRSVHHDHTKRLCPGTGIHEGPVTVVRGLEGAMNWESVAYMRHHTRVAPQICPVPVVPFPHPVCRRCKCQPSRIHTDSTDSNIRKWPPSRSMKDRFASDNT